MTTMRKLVMKVCMDLGYTNIDEAADGSKAWEIISSTAPQVGLVISDWNMPHCTGIDLLRRIRADSRFSKLPFVMVTGEAENHQIAEAAKAGVSSYVVKPFTPELLSEKLSAVYKKMNP